MTPKEKAEYLVDKFKPLVTTWDCYHDTPETEENIVRDAKQCALICVSESLKTLMEYGENTNELQNMDRDIAWWSEVENEINKL